MRASIGAGIVAGILAAVAYGIVMQLATAPEMEMSIGGADAMTMGSAAAMGQEGREPMILMVARMVRSDSIAIAWALLLVAGVGMGALFAATFGGRVVSLPGGLTWGLVYGLFLWVVGALVFMPLVLGMSVFAPIASPPLRTGAIIGLAAYALAGLILGGAFVALRKKPRRVSSDR